MEQALVDGLIDSNPFDSIRLKKILARDQMQSAFRPAPRNMFRYAFYTGMRPSGYIAQAWENVSFVTHQVQVAGAFVDREATRSAKTAAGLRFLDLRQGALESLKAQQAHTKLRGGIIFLNPT